MFLILPQLKVKQNGLNRYISINNINQTINHNELFQIFILMYYKLCSIKILIRNPVEQENDVPHNAGDDLNNTLECEKHREECESGGEEEEEDGENDCPQEKLLHGAVSTVHPVPEGIVLLAYEEPPQGNNTLVLG